MYVSVDHQKLVFLHAHPDYRVVANLDFITNRCDHTSSFPLDSTRPFEHFTLTELQGLFRNTTSKEPLTQDKETLEALLLQVAGLLPATECDPLEVERQAAYIQGKFPDGLPKGEASFSYARSSNYPARNADLFPLTLGAPSHDGIARLLPLAREAVARAQAARQSAANRVSTPPAIPPSPSDRAGGNARAAGKPAPRPRSGVCGLIHDALDARLKETGEAPTREWIKALAVERGWNPSTAGVQYGAWRKQNNLP